MNNSLQRSNIPGSGEYRKLNTGKILRSLLLPYYYSRPGFPKPERAEVDRAAPKAALRKKYIWWRFRVRVSDMAKV
jgi:hypothetical protein